MKSRHIRNCFTANFEIIFFVIISPGHFIIFARLIGFVIINECIHKRYLAITASEVHSCISVIGSEEVGRKLEDRLRSLARDSVSQPVC